MKVACARPENNIAAASAPSGDGSLRFPMSSFDSVVMRLVSPRPTGSQWPAVQDSEPGASAAPDQRSAGTGAGSRPSAQGSQPVIRLVVGLSRHLPFDRRPRRSHPGGGVPQRSGGPDAHRSPGQGSRAADVRTTAKPEPSRSNRPGSSADSRWVSMCGEDVHRKGRSPARGSC
jgi:hypothetical protein